MRIRDIPYLPWIIAVVVLFSIVNVLVRPQAQSNTVAIDENQTVIVAPTSVAQTDSSDNQEVSNNSQVNIPTDTAIAQPTNTITAQPTSTITAQPTNTITAQPTNTITAQPTSTITAQPTRTFTAQPTRTFTAQPTRTFTAQGDVTYTQILAYKAGMKLHSFEDYREAVLDAIRQHQTLFEATYVGPQNELADIYDAMKNYYYPKHLVTLVAQSKTTSPQISFQLKYRPVDAQEAFVQQRVSAIVAELITPGMQPHQKIRVLHDWVVLNTQYDMTFKRYSAYDILKNGSAVCQGYALLMDALLNEAGFNTVYVTGTIKPEFRVNTNGLTNGSHAWNMVQVDGNWYHLDATWDDPMPDRPGVVGYNYYMLTDAEIGLTRTIDEDFSSFMRPIANTAYADAVQSAQVYDALQQAQIQQLMRDTKLLYRSDEYVFGASDIARFDAYMKQHPGTPFVFRAYHERDVSPLVKYYVQQQTAGVNYTTNPYVRTSEPDDVLVEIVLQ